jgi:AraC-like DNA-binding protein
VKCFLGLAGSVLAVTGLAKMRCRRAAILLSTGMRTDAVARELGYANSSHFCHEFKKVYGVAPQSFTRHEGSAEMSP